MQGAGGDTANPRRPARRVTVPRQVPADVAADGICSKLKETQEAIYKSSYGRP